MSDTTQTAPIKIVKAKNVFTKVSDKHKKEESVALLPVVQPVKEELQFVIEEQPVKKPFKPSTDVAKTMKKLKENIFNDDVNSYEKMSLDALANLKVLSGKHKGKLFQDAVSDEPYCKWILSNRKKLSEKNKSLSVFCIFLNKYASAEV